MRHFSISFLQNTDIELIATNPVGLWLLLANLFVNGDSGCMIINGGISDIILTTLVKIEKLVNENLCNVKPQRTPGRQMP